MKIHPVGAELFHADGRTDRQRDKRKDGGTEIKNITVIFSQFPKRT